MRRLLDHRPGDLAPPSPPPELRARTLAVARRTLLGRREPPDLWTRIWSSRPVRLAWASTLVVLVLGHLLVDVADRSRPVGAGPPAAAEADAELAEVLELGRLTVELPGFEIQITASETRRGVGKETS